MNKATEAQDKYKRLKEEYKAARTALVSVTSEAVAEVARGVFEKYPSLESFGWTQYTPYFNDGDVCTFRVRACDETVYLNDKRAYDYDDEERPEELCEAAKEISDLISGFDDDMLLDLYGNHVHVTLSRNGKASVDEYEHD